MNGRGERIRTSDPLVPNQVRYQTALRPEHVLRWDIDARAFRKTQARGWAWWIAVSTLLVYQIWRGGVGQGTAEADSSAWATT